jgi:hypothetical protein
MTTRAEGNASAHLLPKVSGRIFPQRLFSVDSGSGYCGSFLSVVRKQGLEVVCENLRIHQLNPIVTHAYKRSHFERDNLLQ